MLQSRGIDDGKYADISASDHFAPVEIKTSGYSACRQRIYSGSRPLSDAGVGVIKFI